MMGSDPAALIVFDVLNTASLRLQAAEIDTYQLDARLLLQAVLGMEHADLISAGHQKMSEAAAIEYFEFIQRRIRKEPVHRITGRKEFWGLGLEISESVLDPRADTECLVESVISFLDHHDKKNDPIRIADIGTGSGAIILALLSEIPNAKAVATDISRDVLCIAERNAVKLGLDERLDFVQGSYLEPLSGKFDLIVSNPPYIPTRDILSLEPEVKNHDPDISLDGGIDGLDAYRNLLSESTDRLEARGRVFFEIGFDQAHDLREMAEKFEWKDVKITKDYGGNDRVFQASR